MERETAADLALDFIRSKYPPTKAGQMAIDATKTRKIDFGWVFEWNDRRFLETGDFRYELCGNLPIVVFNDGRPLCYLPALRWEEHQLRNSEGPQGTMEDRISSLGEKLGYNTKR